MNILMLTPYLPYPLLSGGQIRTYNLLKHLSRHHQITLFALIKSEAERQQAEPLTKYCQSIHLFKRSEQPFTLGNILHTAVSRYPFLIIRNLVREVTTAVEHELKAQPYDLIHAETFYMMPHLPPTQVPILLVEQTIEYLGYESYTKKASPLLRPLLNLDISKIKHWEKLYWEQAQSLVVMSREDQEFLSTQISDPDKIRIVANGVDAKWFTQVPKQLPVNPTVLFVGTFKWLPNREAVTYLVKEVWPHILKQLPQAKLWIVGNAPSAEVLAYQKLPNITVTGNIPDIRTAFSQAHVLLAPVFSGKGTRYKILEAMASATPVVATPTAVEGLGIKAGQHALIGQSAPSLANLTVNLLKDNKQQTKLANRGVEFVKNKFDWSLIAHQLDDVYRQLGAK